MLKRLLPGLLLMRSSKELGEKLEAFCEVSRLNVKSAEYLLTDRALAALPRRQYDSYLLPRLIDAEGTRVTEELVTIKLPNGRQFWGDRSTGKYYLIHHILRPFLDADIDGDCYKLAYDVQTRYFINQLPWYFPDRDGVLIEGGCFTGLKAIGWSDTLPHVKKIVAVEMGSHNSELLKKNIENNGLCERITGVHAGLWSHSGVGEESHDFSTRHFLLETDRWRRHMKVKAEVPLITLDDLIESEELEVVDYINVQVNGAETEVIQGLNKHLHRVKVIDIAAYYSVDGVPNKELVKEYMLRQGCEVISETPAGRIAFVTPPFKRDILRLDKARYFRR